MTALAHTLTRLRTLQAARAAGYPVSFTTDPAWLLQMAINRRAGWPDDPSTSRGSAHPLPDGRYPPKASGSRWWDARRLADRLNNPRLIVRPGELGQWRHAIEARMPERLTYPWEE